MALRTLVRSLAPGFVPVFLLAGCGSLSSVPLPAKPAGAASVASQPTAQPASRSTHDQVLAAYQGYWQAYGAALRTRNVAAARKLLASFTDGAFLSNVTAPLPRVWGAHEIGYGFAVPHVLSITLAGPSAMLHDCLDLSHLGTQDTRTGRIVPGSFGLPAVNFYVTLTRSAGHQSEARWVISKMQQVEVPCTP